MAFNIHVTFKGEEAKLWLPLSTGRITVSPIGEAYFKTTTDLKDQDFYRLLKEIAETPGVDWVSISVKK